MPHLLYTFRSGILYVRCWLQLKLPILSWPYPFEEIFLQMHAWKILWDAVPHDLLPVHQFRLQLLLSSRSLPVWFQHMHRSHAHFHKIQNGGKKDVRYLHFSLSIKRCGRFLLYKGLMFLNTLLYCSHSWKNVPHWVRSPCSQYPKHSAVLSLHLYLLYWMFL